MKYYSQITRKMYDTPEDCKKAEDEAQALELKKKLETEQKAADRKAAADRVEKARKAMIEAQKAYKKELNDFMSKYKSYHFSSSKLEDVPFMFDDLLDYIFN